MRVGPVHCLRISDVSNIYIDLLPRLKIRPCCDAGWFVTIIQRQKSFSTILLSYQSYSSIPSTL